MRPKKVAASEHQIREVRMVWRGPIVGFMRDETRIVDLEGAIRSGKTTACVWKVHSRLLEEPGLAAFLCRWTDGDTDSKLKPVWRAVCDAAGTPPKWNADEQYDELPNGSRAYIFGLKAADQTLRYCCAPDTLVLKSDLTWRALGDLCETDELVGCDEESHPAGGRGGHRQIRRAAIVGISRFRDQRYRMITTRGEIVVNGEHPFLVISRSRPGAAKTNAIWTPLRELRVGDRLKYLSEPWVDRSDSWLAGMLDGEGSISLNDRAIIQIAQRQGPVMDRVQAICAADGLHGNLYGGYKHQHDCHVLMFCRTGEILRILGSYRPTRLLPKALPVVLSGECSLPNKQAEATILAIEPVGEGEVIGVETSTRTLMTNGFVSHNSKLRGLTVAVIYNDQTEELPYDVFLELCGRLSQVGHRHQAIFSPNPTSPDHWLKEEFPVDNRFPGKSYRHLSIYDNSHNLAPGTIEGVLAAFPPGHAKHRPMVLGLRGLNVIGTPCYKDAFDRRRHEKPVDLNPELPLCEAYDFGKHHPCCVFAQFPLGGGIVLLGGVMGQSLWLEDFLPLVKQCRQLWFGRLSQLLTCCDPAGTHDHAHGTRDNALQVLKKSYPDDHQIFYKENSNAADVRIALVERLAGHMRRRTPWGEALTVDGTKDLNGQYTRWLRVDKDGAEPWSFVSDGFEAGYVWDAHMVSVGSKQMRKPKRDGWYEHGQACVEYLELNFGGAVSTDADDEARRAAARQKEAAARSQHRPMLTDPSLSWMGLWWLALIVGLFV